jgi:hypothetical protein
MPLSYTANDLITDALIEIGALAPGESPDGETGQWSLRKLNDLIDTWQALGAYVYSYQYNIFTLVAGLSPHTIGPAASIPAPTFSTGTEPRPVLLESAAQLLNTGSSLVDLPINLRDHDWWAQNQVKNIQTNVVTDVYYDPTSDIGSLFFWPVPNGANQVRLQYWKTVVQFDAITDPIGGPGGPGTLPQGYRNALKLTLAEMLCPGAQRTASPELIGAALQARAAILGNNDHSPRIRTRDFGMPQAKQQGVRGDFNWVSGSRAGGRPE